MSARTTFTNPLPERTTQYLGLTFLDETGAGFKPTTLTLTLYDVSTRQIINSRDRQDILDLNGATVTAGGVLSLRLDAADTVVVTDGTQDERHIALLEWSWSSGTKTGKHEIEHRVANLDRV